jgi:hypothetical protein
MGCGLPTRRQYVPRQADHPVDVGSVQVTGSFKLNVLVAA